MHRRFVFVIVFIITSANCQLEPGEECTTPNSVTGTCININDCNTLLTLLNTRPLTQANRNFLQRSQCGFEGSRPLVCCPPQSATTSRPTTTTRTTTTTSRSPVQRPEVAVPPPDISRHPNLSLLPTDCGPLNDDRIFGGNRTGIYDFPWMALLAYDTPRGTEFLCGGSIIHQRYILTAAHCITNLRVGNLVGVRVGEHNIRTESDCIGTGENRECAPPVQDFTIEEIIPHPQFNLSRLREDIGLLRLSASIDFQQINSQPICLPTTADLRRLPRDSQNVVVAGWGATETGPNSPDLLRINIPIVNNVRCNDILIRSVPAGIGFRQICAGGIQGVDSCGGDSGGPMMLPSDVSGVQRYVQFGLVSFGPRQCGRAGVPGVYTRIAYYMDWILNQLR